MANVKMKYVFISLEERNGEREYTHNIVREIPANFDVWKYADESQAAQWYEGKPEATDDGITSMQVKFVYL